MHAFHSDRKISNPIATRTNHAGSVFLSFNSSARNDFSRRMRLSNRPSTSPNLIIRNWRSILANFTGRIKRTKLLRKKNLQVNDEAASDRITFEGDKDLQDGTEKELMSLGVGGLAEIFDFIMDNVFTRLKVNNVKGILLYGPPGTGKTALAKALAKILHAKVVMGHELMSGNVDESNHSLRKLFDEATNDYRKYGDQSPLHMIIFDDIDWFTQIDDVNAYGNIFIIGTTNRMDLIHGSLLRPGRLELCLEVGVPNEKGRVNILKVHTQRMNQCGLLDSNVNLEQIASMTVGWSGAELASVAKSALSQAIIRTNSTMLGEVNRRWIRVNQEDFLHGVRFIIHDR
ncbi:vesicular-fusion protein sec18 isoform X2 [Jatropha curcas]|uniref:vesicular-fusion protein sec18 isoform X2 n=1 Tax=Jatropha curcas TaxID=180498 RepID=UPI0009D64A88|nr:vesicular-fusion protein sec18 isoform X2 [Jatropha curcas]